MREGIFLDLVTGAVVPSGGTRLFSLLVDGIDFYCVSIYDHLSL